MEPAGYTFFSTAMGTCAIAWSRAGIVRLSLPEARPATLRSRFRRRYPGCEERQPPGEVRRVIAAVIDHLDHGKVDLARFAVDLDGVPDFEREVYREARKIPAGSTRTYGDIARTIGSPGAARAVGRALGANPVALLVPCHRVVAAGGDIGGFSAGGGTTTKRRILAIEGSELGATQETLFDT